MRISALKQIKTGPITRCAALFIMLMTTANAHALIDVSARQTRSVGFTSSGVQVEYSAQAKIPNIDPVYRKPKTTYSPSRIMNLAKRNNAASRAVNTVLIAAAASAGYIIDELTDQVMHPATGEGFEDNGTWISGYYFEIHYPTVRLSNYGPTTDVCSGNGGELFPNGTGGYTCYLPDPASPNLTKHYAMPRYSCPTSPQKVDGFWYSEWLPYSKCGTSPIAPEPLSDSEFLDFVTDALKSMSPEALREFFNNTAGLPELTPELEAELQTWADELALEYGDTTAIQEATDLDVAPDIQEVDVNAEGVETLEGIATDIDGWFDGMFPPLTEPALPSLPVLPTLPPLPQETPCQQMSVNILGFGNLEIPGEQGCTAFEIRKDMYGWYMSIITFFLCLGILLKPSGQGV